MKEKKQVNTNSHGINDSCLITIDTIRVDEQSRLTLTKRVKQVLPIETGDKIAIYEECTNPTSHGRYNGEIIK